MLLLRSISDFNPEQHLKQTKPNQKQPNANVNRLYISIISANSVSHKQNIVLMLHNTVAD